MNHKFTANTPIQTVIQDPAFGSFGRLLFPVNTGYWSGATLGSLKLTWYSHIDPNKTVENTNNLRERALAGETIFYDIYTEKEKATHPARRNTGLDEYSPGDPPTFVCVGDSDWIAPWRLMKARVDAMSACGIDTEFHCYPGLSHGFGLGTGTAAEGWLDLAIRFWERQIKNQKQNLKQKTEKSRSDKQ